MDKVLQIEKPVNGHLSKKDFYTISGIFLTCLGLIAAMFSTRTTRVEEKIDSLTKVIQDYQLSTTAQISTHTEQIKSIQDSVKNLQETYKAIDTKLNTILYGKN